MEQSRETPPRKWRGWATYYVGSELAALGREITVEAETAEQAYELIAPQARGGSITCLPGYEDFDRFSEGTPHVEEVWAIRDAGRFDSRRFAETVLRPFEEAPWDERLCRGDGDSQRSDELQLYAGGTAGLDGWTDGTMVLSLLRNGGHWQALEWHEGGPITHFVLWPTDGGGPIEGSAGARGCELVFRNGGSARVVVDEKGNGRLDLFVR